MGSTTVAPTRSVSVGSSKASLFSSSYSPGHPGLQLCTLQALLALSPVSPVRAPSVHAPQCVRSARPGTPLSGPHAGAGPIPWVSRPLLHWRASAALPRHMRPSGPPAPVWAAGARPGRPRSLRSHVALRRAHRLINYHPGTPPVATSPWRRCGGGTSAYCGASADRHATLSHEQRLRPWAEAPSPTCTSQRLRSPAAWSGSRPSSLSCLCGRP